MNLIVDVLPISVPGRRNVRISTYTGMVVVKHSTFLLVSDCVVANAVVVDDVHAIAPGTARELLGRHVNFGRENRSVRALHSGILRDDRELSRSRLGDERPVCACGQNRPPFTWCGDMSRGAET